MANLYSVIPGLVPTSQEIVEAELLAKQVLEGKFPDLDLREGTGLRDLVLRPTAYAFALLRKANDYYFTQNTLAGVTDATPTETLDDILSNWFLTRNTGTIAVIGARLYFARQKNVTLTSDVSFSTDNVLQFFPQTSQVYNASAMQYDSYSNEWYLDVTLQASTTGTQYNISEGSLLYFANFDPYFLHAEVSYLAQASIAAETNTQFINRASSAISTRNLINIPSVDSLIKATFNYISNVVTVGAGDADMIRDMIRVVLEDSTPIQSTSVVTSGDMVRVYADTTGLYVGQYVVFTEATPSIYNGTFTVTLVTSTYFTVSIPGNPGFISTLPKVSPSQVSTYVHNGGMVDVYCDYSLSTSIIQVTTDSNGVASIPGASYSIARSSITGGPSEDIIPVNTEVTDPTPVISYSPPSVSLVYSGAALSVGDSVKVSGLTQSTAISSISCVGLTVSVAASGHGAMPGSKITVSGVTPDSYNGTYVVTYASTGVLSYSVPSHIASSGYGPSMVLGNGSLQDGAIVSSKPIGHVVVSLPNMWPSYLFAPVLGTATVTAPTKYTLRNHYAKPKVTRTAVSSFSTVTVTYSNHGISVGRRVTISDASNSHLNGVWVVTATPTDSTFQFTVPSLSGVSSVTSQVGITYVDQRYDYGFSTRQLLDVDFGVGYANSTASFQVGTFTHVDSIQTYLEDPSNRVLCGDYLARGFNIYSLDVSVTVYNGTLPSDATISSTITNVLSGMSPGATLVLSDLASALTSAGVTNIKTPIGVDYSLYTRDLTPVETGSITDYLDPFDKTSVFVLNSVSTYSETV